MFSTLRKLFCFKKEPKTPLGFCDGPTGERKTTLFCCNCRTIDIYKQPYEAENELHIAVCTGNLKVALHLLAKENFHVNDEDKRKRTALHFACFYGYMDLVYFLLFNKCEINVLDDQKSTPLMKAVQSLEADIVYVVLVNGADPNIKDANGHTAMHLAVYGDSVEIASSLLEFGGNIDETTEDGLTPLMLALQERKLLIAEYLITQGANIHARDGHQRTTLMYGVKWDCQDIVELLLKRGVDHTLRDEFRWSALQYAIVGKRKVKRLILDHMDSLISRTHTFIGDQPKDIFSSGHHFNSVSLISVCSRTEDRVNFETQQDIPENILQNGIDDFQTMASKQYETTEAQEEEPELETIPDLKQENEDVFSMNEEYQKLDSSRKAAHSSKIGNYAEESEINQVWAEKCLHPELRDYSHQISKPETEPQQSQPVWAYKCLHPELRDYVHQISIPQTEPEQLQGDTVFSEELDEETQEYKTEKEESLDKIEEYQEFSVSDPNGLQEASTDTPQSSNMGIEEEKNVIRHLEKKSVMEDQKRTSEEEQIQDNGRKNKRPFIDAIRACFCSCFTKKLSSSPTTRNRRENIERGCL